MQVHGQAWMDWLDEPTAGVGSNVGRKGSGLMRGAEEDDYSLSPALPHQPPHQPPHAAHPPAPHARLLSWFLDAPAVPFGMHRMALTGKVQGKDVDVVWAKCGCGRC
ncbi:hypothetical protein B0H11DRAFT_2259910 [Mycena galericulata]|nr:hypothetical protein B0H11DRAFT_2259910 [Mycena galericulata]